jgi:hypothetical protein
MRTRLIRGLITVLLVLAMLAAGAGSLHAQPALDGTAASETAASESPLSLFGGLKPRMFRNLPFYDALRAEHHAARNKLLIPAWSEGFPHSENAGRRFAWQVHLGAEFPIVAFSTSSVDDRMEPGEWGFGLWTPVSFHMVEDFKDDSNPIVNTDYRFGAMLKFQYGLRDKLRLGIRYVPWAHESTHLGDEYVIIAQRPTLQPPFERVNVSYEYQEYGVSFEGHNLFKDEDEWTVRHGGIIPWGSDGYYSDHLLGSDDPVLTPSRKNYEPSFGVEYVLPPWPDEGKSRRVYLSFDLRDKLVYNYHQTAGNPERRQWSWNLHIGRTLQRGDNKALKDYFLQIYRGVNPYGQLRSQPDYWSIGVGWIFGI